MRTLVGVFDNDQNAEKALNELNQRGFGSDVEMVATGAGDELDDGGRLVEHGDRDPNDPNDIRFPGIIPAAVPGAFGNTTATVSSGTGAGGYVPVPLFGTNLAEKLHDMGVPRDEAVFFARAAKKDGILLLVKADDEHADEILNIMRDANGTTSDPAARH